MLTLTTIFYGVALFCNIIVCAVSVIFFIFSLKHCIKKGKFDFIEMFKNFFIFSTIALISFIPKYGLLKISKNSPVKTVSYKDEKRIKKINDYRKKQGKEIILVEKNQSDAYLEYLKKNKLDKKALK